jgi:hypothetical protein
MGVIVKIQTPIKLVAILSVTVLIVLSLFFNYSHSYAYKKNAVPAPVKLSPRLQALFEKTKILCFGRYAIEVPRQAQLVPGGASFPSRIEIFSGGFEKAKRIAAEKIEKLKREDDTAEITYNGLGPVENTWQLRYYESESAKKYALYFFNTFISKGDLTFMLGDATETGETESTVITRQQAQAGSWRLRAEEEVPTEPGFCIENAFLADDRYGDQEMVYAGIYLPSLPDVTFSISSNKDAYADYPKARFEEMKRDELPLLARIKKAQKVQGVSYPKRDVLREGKRDVQHWKGEESLILRPDGTHDFEWAFVGTPKDVANPSEFHAAMFTKVEHNIVGAAKKASVSDDVSGLKFRVKVPGAPEGSYVFPKGKLGTSDVE